MKTIIKFTLSLLLFSFAISANAQKFGATPEDSISCIQSISFLRDEMKQGNMEEALPLYHTILRLCPKASQNTYLHGIRIMKHFAKKATDEVEKQKYVDTILMLYDTRFELFGKPSKGEIAYRKAAELLEFRPSSHAQIAHEYQEAIANGYIKADAYAQIMQQTKFLYEQKEVDGETVANKYEQLIKDIDNLPEGEEKDNARKTVEGLFLAIPELNSCENLIAMYTPKFEADPENIDLIRAIRYRLSTTEGCKETQLFADVVEAGYKLEPNAESAIMLAQLFIIRGEKDKGMSYMDDAIKMETDPLVKSKYQLQVAAFHLQEGRVNQALTLARGASSINPNAGEAYMIIGNCYARKANGASNCDFGGRAIFWLVVDQFQKAKSVDPSLANSANTAIATYSKHFPSYNDIFLNEYTVGQSYTVNCNGVVGTTTIRAAKQ